MPGSQIFRWLLDVAPLWPYSYGGGERILTNLYVASTPDYQAALGLLPPEEQEKVLRYHFARDAKLSLGSCLLKRKAIAEVCRVPWLEITIGQDSNGKPCYIPDDPSMEPPEFNVSHHGSLVTLVGCVGNSPHLGIDVVKIDFEKDYGMVVNEGFSSWAHTYEAVFSDREMNEIAQYVPETDHGDPREIIRAKLRHFYAHWCLKEAYVKMTALLAAWLKELEFRNVQVPLSAKHLSNDGNAWGQTCHDMETWFRGKQLLDISLEIQAFREDYMIATAASSSSISFPSFQELDFERDIRSKVACK